MALISCFVWFVHWLICAATLSVFLAVGAKDTATPPNTDKLNRLTWRNITEDEYLNSFSRLRAQESFECTSLNSVTSMSILIIYFQLFQHLSNCPFFFSPLCMTNILYIYYLSLITCEFHYHFISFPSVSLLY